MRKTIAIFGLLIGLTFSSCTENDLNRESNLSDNTSKINQVLNEKHYETQKLVDENKIIENLKIFSKNFFQISLEIDEAFNKTPKSNINVLLKNKVLNINNDLQFNQVMTSIGFINSNEILILLKKRHDLVSIFRSQTPDFYLLDLNTRNELFTREYNLVLEEYFQSNNSLSKNLPDYSTESCESIYNTAIGRCNRDYGKCAATAIIAAAGGFWPGVGVAIFCAWDLSDCRSDAREDYESCINN